MKVQITLDDALMQRADEYAAANYMSRSGLVALSLTSYLNQVDVVSAVCSMALSMKKIADTGVVDTDTLKKLEDFERLSKLLISK